MLPWSKFYPLVLPSTPGAPDPLMDLELRNAAIEFFRRTRIWCVWLDPITSQAGVREYDFELPTMATVARVEAVKVNGSDVDVASYRDAPPLTSADSSGQAYGSAMGTLVMATDYGDGARIDVQAALVPTRNALGIDAALFEQHATDIAEGAKKRLMLIPNQPWSNASQAAIASGLFEDAVATQSTIAWRGRTSTRKRTVGSYF